MPVQHEARRAVYVAVRDEAILSRRFVALSCLSSAIAAFGLLGNSPVAILGAMLVAPLMGPIIGSAMAMAMGLDRLFRRSIVAEIVGLFCAVGIGYLVGQFPLHPHPGSEIMGRTTANLFDLGVAVMSGIAGGYATVNPKVNPAFVGAAIAVSLMPPLVVCGLMLSYGMHQLAFGAFMLFLVNYIGIQLSVATVFLAAGFRPSQSHDETRTAYLSRFLPSLAVFAIMVVIGARGLANLVSEENTRRTIERVLTDAMRQRTGSSLGEIIEVREEGDRLMVVATAFTARAYDAAGVAAIDRKLQTALNRPVELIIRSLPSTDISAQGRVNLDPDDEQSLAMDRSRRILRDALVEGLKGVKDARLSSLNVTYQESEWDTIAVVYASSPIGPDKVRVLESAMQAAIQAPVRLRVETSHVVAADRNGYIAPDVDPIDVTPLSDLPKEP